MWDLLGRAKSNHGALAAAVFVGLLAVILNQTLASKPEIVGLLLEQYGSLLKGRRADAALDPHQSLAQLLDALEDAELSLSKLYEGWKSARTPASSEIERLALIVQANLAVLEAGETAPSEDRHRGRLLALNAYFIIAEMSPAEHSKVFLDYCQVLMETDLSRQHARTVELLRAYHGVSQAGESGRLGALRDYTLSRGPAAVNVGAELHLIVAQDLAGRRQRNAAREVLQQGLRMYQGQPEALMLLHELTSLNR